IGLHCFVEVADCLLKTLHRAPVELIATEKIKVVGFRVRGLLAGDTADLLGAELELQFLYNQVRDFLLYFMDARHAANELLTPKQGAVKHIDNFDVDRDIVGTPLYTSGEHCIHVEFSAYRLRIGIAGPVALYRAPGHHTKSFQLRRAEDQRLSYAVA